MQNALDEVEFVHCDWGIQKCTFIIKSRGSHTSHNSVRSFAVGLLSAIDSGTQIWAFNWRGIHGHVGWAVAPPRREGPIAYQSEWSAIFTSAAASALA